MLVVVPNAAEERSQMTVPEQQTTASDGVSGSGGRRQTSGQTAER